MKKRVKSLPWVVSYASRNFVKFCLLWIFSLSSLMIQAQDNQRISIDLRGETLEAALWYLQNRTKFVFMYGTEDIANVTDITIKAKDKTITEILDECLEGTNLTYEISGSAIVIKKKQSQKVTISGWIRDASGEALPGATVTIRGRSGGYRLSEYSTPRPCWFHYYDKSERHYNTFLHYYRPNVTRTCSRYGGY